MMGNIVVVGRGGVKEEGGGGGGGESSCWAGGELEAHADRRQPPLRDEPQAVKILSS